MKLFKLKGNWLITLRMGISSVFISIFLFISFLFMILITLTFSKSLLIISDNLVSLIAISTSRELSRLLEPVVAASQLTSKAIVDRALNTADPRQLTEYMIDVLETLPQATVANWGSKEGNYVSSFLNEDQTYINQVFIVSRSQPEKVLLFRNKEDQIIKHQKVNSNLDPRKRPWYQLAAKTHAAGWTAAYILLHGHVPGIAYYNPVYRNNQLLGVFSIHVRLDSLSRFLETHKFSPHGLAFILDSKGNIIAHPQLKQLINNEKLPTNRLINIRELKNPLLKQAYSYFLKSKKNNFTYQYNKENYLIDFVNIPQFEHYGWVLGVVAPENDFLGEIKKFNKIITILLVVILLLGLELISLFSKQISIPIQKLANQLHRIRFFELERNRQVKSRVKEVFIMANAIESMRVGLQSFQKYVPQNLVRQLIENGEAAKIGGHNRRITLLFSDISNFTTTTEQIGSEKIMQLLCQYFNELTQIIGCYQGTVDKYIGDSIMAFWGAPVPDSLCTFHACKAALECQDRVAKLNQQWKKEIGVELPTRIGLHHGRVTVGNLGAMDRLNYTAIGDPVNVTSRIEQLNKVYGTKILASEIVQKNVNELFIFRVIDKVKVKGRIEASIIYELIAEKKNENNKKILNFCQIYEQGFIAYQLQSWQEAIDFFKEALVIFPYDLASQIMIKRCEEMKGSVINDWNGVWRYNYQK